METRHEKQRGGPGRDLVGKVCPLQTQGSRFDPQNQCKRLGVMASTCFSGTREVEKGRLQVLLTRA